MNASDTPPQIDPSRPHAARMYDYFIGGKNHFAADRKTADEVLRKSPSVRIAARENRAFLGRTIRYLTAEAGIRQFLDIGTGLPTTNNVHQVAQEVTPSTRVVYVDNDPLVLAHARALLTSTPEGRARAASPLPGRLQRPDLQGMGVCGRAGLRDLGLSPRCPAVSGGLGMIMGHRW